MRSRALPGAFRGLAPLPCPSPASPPTPPRRGFDFSGGAWATLVGKPGPYLLYSDGAGVRCEAQIVAAGTGGKALFIQAVTLTRGPLRTTAALSKVGARWQTSGERQAPALLWGRPAAGVGA